MDQQLIKSLIDALESSSLSSLEYSEGGETLRLARRGAEAPPVAAVPLQHAVAQPQSTPTAPARADGPSAAPAPAPALHAVSPLYGVVHLQAAPGEPPFVAPGDTVQPGQTLCVVEAMKVFNEVQADRAGTVAALLVSNGQEVDAGTPLLRWA